MNLYRFYWDCGRMGSVEGLFVATPDQIAEAIGRQVCLGEVLGKHSDVYGDLEEKDITLVSDDNDKVSWFSSIVGGTGYNPLDYIEDEEE